MVQRVSVLRAATVFGALSLCGGCWLLESEGGDEGPECGDGIAEGSEQCDLMDLRGETCASLYPGVPLRPQATLQCGVDCTFNVSGCGDYCGDWEVDAGEDCDPPGWVMRCDTLGFDYGEAVCGETCLVDRTACGSCQAGQAYCEGACVDVTSDPERCGACDTRCGSGEPCLGGRCFDRGHLWTGAGGSLVDEQSDARGHALAVWDGIPTVALVAAFPGGRSVTTRWWTGGSWSTLVHPASGAATEIADVVAMSDDHGDLHVAWAGSQDGGPPLTHLVRWDGATVGWTELGAPGLEVGCADPAALALAVSAEVAELLVTGQGVCGDTVTAVACEQDGWVTRPGPASVGLLTASAAGRPALAIATRPWIALSERTPSTGAARHFVLGWTQGLWEWVPLGDALDETPAAGIGEDAALATDAEDRLVVAWSEAAADASGLHDVYVKTWDPAVGVWNLLGSAPVNALPGAVEPSVTVIGGRPWVAFVSTTAGVRHVTVVTYEPATGQWLRVGRELNRSLLEPAWRPVIVSAGGLLFVAFREGQEGAQRLYVSTYP